MNDVFSEGIKPIGPKDLYEIKILICYIIKAIGSPMSHDELSEALQESELVNFFSFSEAFQGLLDAGMIIEKDEKYDLTEQGKKTAYELESFLSYSVREYALNSAIRAVAKNKAINENLIEIVPLDEGYTIKIEMKDGDISLLKVEVPVADKKAAEMIKENFLSNPVSFYRGVLHLLTSSEV